MKGIISVIVPVYNVEKYIRESIESILKQEFSCLEIILIDDGSTDHSGKICDEYAKMDGRIKVIHQKNGGAASAKNAGLRVATGEYLAFLDSDDYLEPDAYFYMLSKLEAYDADVIQCSFRNIYVGKQEEKINCSALEEIKGIEYLRCFTTNWTCGLLWDKLYRRDLFDGVFFEEDHKIDDEFFTYQGIMNARKVLQSPKITYNYRMRQSSVMRNRETQQQIILDKLDYLDKRRKKVIAKFPELKQDFDYHFLSMLVILSKEYAATLESIQQTQRLLREYLEEDKYCTMEFSLKRKLFLLLCRKPEKILRLKTTDNRLNCSYQYFE